nr:M14 metal carboxypeptidase 9 [Antheraea pernyi]
MLTYFCFTWAGKHDIYSRHSVHGVKIRDRSDLQILHELEEQLDLDVWQHGMPGQRDALVMVNADNANSFLEALDVHGIVHYLHVSDVAKAFQKHDEDMTQWRKSRSNRMIFDDYPRYTEVDAYLERIAAQYPNLVTLVNAGPSYEGRVIKYLKISTTNFNNTSKPIYFMDAMIHAREWVTTPVTLYSIYRLVENLRTEDRDLLEDIDWIILPLVNPDGYEYSHTDDRLWRRTRSVNLTVSTTCFGVDGNRNFDVAFNTVGVSENPCAQTYPGTEPFSEPETRIVRDILLEYLNRIQLYNNIHSHGNYVLFGFGFNNSVPSNGPQLHHVAAAMGAVMDAQKLPQAGFYLVGNSGMVLYETSGSAQDYGQIVGVPFSYTLELPGYGYDFRVPPTYMDHMNEETWQGIAITARLSRTYYTGPYTTTSRT